MFCEAETSQDHQLGSTQRNLFTIDFTHQTERQPNLVRSTLTVIRSKGRGLLTEEES